MTSTSPSSSGLGQSVYITTPIYYVNDRPHIGHCYTTLVADTLARYHRMALGPAGGRDVFLLTGTDEHAEKVVASASAHGMSAQAWADLNAQRFRDAFAFMGFTHNDFVRTSEDRHKLRASAYIQRLVDSGDIVLGDYEGWWDASQEEYVPENTAREHDYKSPVTKKPLEKRAEQNYFFHLDKHESWLRGQIESGAIRVLPEARRNEVLGRIRQGLQRVPVSRRIKQGELSTWGDWGIRMPNDPQHRVYVWIEALCNYLTVVDNAHPACDTSAREGGPRRRLWPVPSGSNGPRPSGSGPGGERAMQPLPHGRGSSEHVSSGSGSLIVHLMAKDILWFHAVVWPAMLHALGERPPNVVYAHAYWVAEGVKMSKSLGNFIEIDDLHAYAQRYSLDAVRWYLLTQGPLGATDADFSYKRFVEVYNADLANGLGNCASRVGNMIDKYFGGVVPEHGGRFRFDRRSEKAPAASFAWDQSAPAAAASAWQRVLGNEMDIAGALSAGVRIIGEVDQFINVTEPFRLAKRIDEPGVREELGSILYCCAEAIRLASLLMSPALPAKACELWRNWGCAHLRDAHDPASGFVAPLDELARWADATHGLRPGQRMAKGEPLFMRADPAQPPPSREQGPAA